MPPQRRGASALVVWSVLPVILVATAFRLIGLGSANLWGDEAFSVMASLGPPSRLLGLLATAEPHPPLYPFLLVGWLRAFGSSELAARLSSAFCGIAAVAIAAVLARSFAPSGDRPRAALAALIGALLVALSPFQIWYSQEARMYAQLSFFAALSALALLRLWQGKKWAIPFYALAVVGAAGSHYYGLFLPLAHGLAVLSSARQNRAAFLRWVRATAIAVVLYLPWVVVALPIFTSYYGGAPGSENLPQVALSAWARVIAGWSASWSDAVTIAAIVSFLAVIGLVVPSRSELDRFTWLVLVFWLVTPFVGGYAVSLVRPLYNERYLSVVSIPIFLLVARGVAWLISPSLDRVKRLTPASLLVGGRLALGVTTLVVGVLAVVPSLRGFESGAYIQSAYDTHVKTMDLLARPGDAVILDGATQEPLYRYYAHLPLPFFTLPSALPLDPAATTAELARIAAEHGGAWVFWYATPLTDPNNVIGKWLATHEYLALDTFATNARLQYFQLAPDAALTQRSTDLTFGDALHLDGYSLADLSLAGGEAIPVDLRWRWLANPAAIRVSLRLVDARGFTWAQFDQDAGGGYVSAATWPVGQATDDRHGLMVPLGAPPGDYLVELDVYAAADSRPLAPVGNGAPLDPGGVRLATIHVSQASRAVWTNGITGFHASNATWSSGLDLLGYTSSDQTQAGKSSNLSLVWQATSAEPLASRLRVQLVNGEGSVAEERELPLSTETDPVSGWRAGEVRWEQYRLPLSDQLAPGTYRVAILPMQAGSTGTPPGSPLLLGSLAVGRAAVTSAPTAPPRQPLSFDLDQKISLKGYDLSADHLRPGDKLSLTLYWNDRAPVDGDYTVFVHVLNAAEKVVAQQDQSPEGGARPTSSWFPGDIVLDHYTLSLPGSLPPGDYPIEVGMYNPTNGARLPVSRDGEPAGDRIIVAHLTVMSNE